MQHSNSNLNKDIAVENEPEIFGLEDPNKGSLQAPKTCSGA